MVPDVAQPFALAFNSRAREGATGRARRAVLGGALSIRAPVRARRVVSDGDVACAVLSIRAPVRARLQRAEPVQAHQVLSIRAPVRARRQSVGDVAPDANFQFARQ